MSVALPALTSATQNVWFVASAAMPTGCPATITPGVAWAACPSAGAAWAGAKVVARQLAKQPATAPTAVTFGRLLRGFPRICDSGGELGWRCWFGQAVGWAGGSSTNQ